MWIVTEFGFFSFVVDRTDSSVVHLRARLREDLEANFPGVEVYAKPGADYLFRARITKTQLAERMTQMIMDDQITGHFKDEAIRRSAKPKHGSRSSAYYGFWNGMAALQPYAPYSKTPRPEPRSYVPAPKLSRPGDHGLPAAGTGRVSRSQEFTSPSGLYGGLMDGNQYGRDYVWGSDAGHDAVWGADDALELPGEPSDDPLGAISDEEWARMTPEEVDAYLDRQEAYAKRIEDGTALPPSLEVLFRDEDDAYPAPVSYARDWEQVEKDRRAADRRRQAGRKGRKASRKNRHNQRG